MGKIFYGSYLRNLDEKGRLLLPSTLLKGEEVDRLYVLKGFDGCLSVYLPDEFSALMDELKHMDFRDPGQRAFVRLSLASIKELKFDSHGRVLLGADTLAEYGLGREILILGAMDHLEFWDKKAFAAYNLRNGASFDAPVRRS